LQQGRLPSPVIAEQNGPSRRLALPIGKIQRLLFWPEAPDIPQAKRKEISRWLIFVPAAFFVVITRAVLPVGCHGSSSPGRLCRFAAECGFRTGALYHVKSYTTVDQERENP
jgi:hypothetical protein